MKELVCNKDYHYLIVKWCLEDVLDMESYGLKTTSCIIIGMDKGEFSPPDHIYIGQDLVPPEEFRILFHEIRHYFQFRNGMYDVIASKFHIELPADMPEEQKILERKLAYKQLPWEIDANDFAMETLRKFWKNPVSLPYRLTQLPAR